MYYEYIALGDQLEHWRKLKKNRSILHKEMQNQQLKL